MWLVGWIQIIEGKTILKPTKSNLVLLLKMDESVYNSFLDTLYPYHHYDDNWNEFSTAKMLNCGVQVVQKRGKEIVIIYISKDGNLSDMEDLTKELKPYYLQFDESSGNMYGFKIGESTYDVWIFKDKDSEVCRILLVK